MTAIAGSGASLVADVRPTLTSDHGDGVGTMHDADLVLHTLFDSPKEQAIADTGYAGTPVELRRFK